MRQPELFGWLTSIFRFVSATGSKLLGVRLYGSIVRWWTISVSCFEDVSFKDDKMIVWLFNMLTVTRTLYRNISRIMSYCYVLQFTIRIRINRTWEFAKSSYNTVALTRFKNWRNPHSEKHVIAWNTLHNIYNSQCFAPNFTHAFTKHYLYLVFTHFLSDNIKIMTVSKSIHIVDNEHEIYLSLFTLNNLLTLFTDDHSGG